MRLSETQIDGLDATPLEKFAWAQQRQRQRQQQQQHQVLDDTATLGQAEPVAHARIPSLVQGLPLDNLAESPERSDSNVLFDSFDDGLLIGEHGIIHNSSAGAASSIGVGCSDAQEAMVMAEVGKQHGKWTQMSTEDTQWLPMAWEDLSSAGASDAGDGNSEGFDLDNSLDLDLSLDVLE